MKKIKICFLHQNLVCGGADKALLDLVTLMDKDLFDITVFAIQGGGEWEPRFMNLGIRVINPYSNLSLSTKNPFTNVFNLFKIRKIEKLKECGGDGLLDYCCKDKFDVIVSYHINNYCRFAPFVKYKAKTVKFIHGDAVTNDYFREKVLQLKAYVNRFDRIVCVSEAAKKSFEIVAERTEGVVTAYNPIVGSEIIEKSNTPTLTPDEKYVCAVGRFEREKGFPRLVRIHKRLLDAGLYHKLVIIGEGYEREAIEKAIEETGTNDSVILTGYCDNPYPYMKNAYFMVCSSYTEGLPVVSAESLSLGVPMVSSYPTVGEIFGDEPCGVITENDDNSLYEGMYKMLSDKDFYDNTKAAAKRRSEFFTGRQMVEKVENVFQNLCNK